MERQQNRKSGCCLVALVVMLILTIAIVFCSYTLYKSALSLIPRVEEEATLSLEEIEAIENETEDIPDGVEVVDDVTMPGEDAELLESNENIMNILLIGQDRRPGEGRQRSDSMILCTINTEKKTLVMTSFLRDMYVDIPDWNGRSYQDNRLNVCYALGGMGMLNTALEKNFGIQVDHNMEVDFSGFKNIVSLFGGVSINLTKAEADYLGQGLKEGVNFLNPEQALNYSRIRYIDSDFGRTNRQRKVIMSLFSSVKNMSVSELTNLVTTILPMVTTNMSDADITNYMMKILPILSELQITTQYIPVDGSYRSVYIRGMAVLVPDLPTNIAVLKKTLG